MSLILNADHGIFLSDSPAVQSTLEALGIPSVSVTPNANHSIYSAYSNQSYSNSTTNNLDFRNGDSSGFQIRDWAHSTVQDVTGYFSKDKDGDSINSLGYYGDGVISKSYRRVRLQGTLNDLNALLPMLKYVPDKDYNGQDSITALVCDECFAESVFFPGSSAQNTFDKASFSSDDCSLCHSQTLPIALAAINDGPELNLPQYTLTVHEDDSFVFDETVNIIDVDSDNQPLTLRMMVDHGTLTLPVFPSNLTLLNGTGDRDFTIWLSGPIGYLNIALASMIYTPPQNWHSLKTGNTDAIHFLVDDNGNSGGMYDQANFTDEVHFSQSLTVTGAIVMVVLPGINHRPSVSVPGATYVAIPCQSQDGQEASTQIIYHRGVLEQCERIVSIDIMHLDEDTVAVIPGVVISDVDEKDRKFGNGQFQVNLTAVHGHVAVPNCDLYGVSMQRGATYWDNNTVALTGTLSQINGALVSLTYTPPPNYYGPEYISVHVTDQPFGSNGLTSNETIPIVVDPVTDRPYVNVPQDLTLLEVFEDTHIAIKGIEVESPDFREMSDGLPTYSRDLGNQHLNTYNRTTPGSPSTIMNKRYPFVKLFNEWNVTTFREQDGGTVRLTIKSIHGSVMIANRRGIAFINTPNAALEAIRLR